MMDAQALRYAVRIWLRRLQGRWRLWWGFCPQCNSDAPELYACPVCEYYHGEYPPSAETKAAWLSRFEHELYVPPGYREFIKNTRTLCGVYKCTNCGHTERREQEVTCWKCGRGEMVWDIPF